MDWNLRIPVPLGTTLYPERHPRVHDGLVAFVEGPSDFECVADGGVFEFCIRFVDMRLGRTFSHLGNVSSYEVVTSGGYFAQITDWMPTSPSGLVVRFLANGTLASWSVSAEHPLSNMDSADGRLVLGLRPYSRSLPVPWNVVNELGVVPTVNFTAQPITKSLDRAQEVELSRLYLMSCFSDFTWEVSPRITETLVVWQDNRNSAFRLDPANCGVSGVQWDGYVYDIASGTETAVRANPWNETHPDIDSGILVWSDDRNGDWDVYALYLDDGREVRLTEDPADQRNPVTSRGCVAWEDNRAGNWDIYGLCIPTPPWATNRTGSREDVMPIADSRPPLYANRTVARNLTEPPRGTAWDAWNVIASSGNRSQTAVGHPTSGPGAKDSRRLLLKRS